MSVSSKDPSEKHLFIVRHAHAQRSDLQRDLLMPLTDRGQLRSKEMAGFIGDFSVTIGADPSRWLLLVSPAKRTRQTANPIEEKLHGITVKYIDMLYQARPQQIMDLICDIDETIEAAIIVGHNPSLSVLAQNLWDEDDRYLGRGDIIIGKLNHWHLAEQTLFIEHDKPKNSD